MFTHNIFSYQILQYLFADCRVIELFYGCGQALETRYLRIGKKHKTYFPNLNLGRDSSA